MLEKPASKLCLVCISHLAMITMSAAGTAAKRDRMTFCPQCTVKTSLTWVMEPVPQAEILIKQ